MVEIVSGDNISSPPGRVHTIVFKVSNLGRSEAIFQPSLNLPDAWHLAGDLVPVSVPGEGSAVCFVTFRIPETAEAGNYQITFLVAHTENADIRASIDARTTVEEMYDMELSITRHAEYAPAGRELVFSVFLLNKGNTEATFKLDANGSHDAAVRLEKSKVFLMPQESATIQARISTNGSLDHKIVQQAVVRAAIKEYPTRFESATTHVNVIPLYARLKPKAVTVPVYVSLQTVGDEQGTGAQLSVSGSIEALGGNISVDMNLANNNRLPMFGTRESYRIRYDRRNLRINLGDHIQEISPLTTTGHYGAGISAQGKAGKFDFMGTALKTRYVFPTQSILGGSLGYQVNPAIKVSTNVLHRVGLYDGTVATVRGVFSPFGNRHKLNLECGLDTGGGLSEPSCMVVVLGSSTRIGYQGRILRTSGSFPGSNKNLSEYFGNVSYQFSWGLRLDGTYRDQKRDFFDGYGRSSDYLRVGGGFSQRIGPASTFLDVHYLRQHLSHQSSELVADRIEEALRIRSGFQMRAVGLRGSVDIGRAESSAFSYKGSVIRSRVSARISPTSKLTFSASGDYASGYLINTARQMSRWLVSGQISIRLDNSTQFVTTVYRNTTTTLDKQLYTSYQAQLRHTFRSGHRLQIRGQHSLMEGFRSSGSTDYKISYSLPLGIPMRTGKVSDDYISGRIYDAEADAGMEGVLIFLGDGVTISEKDGTFKIPRSHSGTDFLRIDQKSIGIDRVPLIQMPLQIDMDDPYLDIIEIPVVRAASLEGSISLYGSATGQLMIGEDPLRMQKNSVIRDVILELSSGEDRFRTRTDRSGRYRFIGIRPGTYKLKIIIAPLSDKYTINPTVVNISPKSGEKIIQDFSARPIVRKIIMLNSSDLSVLSTDETDTSVGTVIEEASSQESESSEEKSEDEGSWGEREKSKKDDDLPLSMSEHRIQSSIPAVWIIGPGPPMGDHYDQRQIQRSAVIPAFVGLLP